MKLLTQDRADLATADVAALYKQAYDAALNSRQVATMAPAMAAAYATGAAEQACADARRCRIDAELGAKHAADRKLANQTIDHDALAFALAFHRRRGSDITKSGARLETEGEHLAYALGGADQALYQARHERRAARRADMPRWCRVKGVTIAQDESTGEEWPWYWSNDMRTVSGFPTENLAYSDARRTLGDDE